MNLDPIFIGSLLLGAVALVSAYWLGHITGFSAGFKTGCHQAHLFHRRKSAFEQSGPFKRN